MDSLLKRAEEEATQQYQDAESDAMKAQVEGTIEAKSEEDGETAKFTEIGSEEAGLATAEHLQEESQSEDLQKTYKTTTNQINETAKTEKVAKTTQKEATERERVPLGNTNQKGDRIQQTTVLCQTSGPSPRSTKDNPVEQVNRARPVGKENTLEETAGVPTKGLRRNTGPAAVGAHHVKPSAAVVGAQAHGNTTQETTGMAAKGLRRNTGTTAAEAHYVKPSAAVVGAHAQEHTLEVATGMPAKGLRRNTGTTAARAHHVPSATVVGAHAQENTLEVTTAATSHGARCLPDGRDGNVQLNY
ncbi:unknown protein [Seminavis robusta]|uniref:Uncharacterized protein n=1 Tax=Seminavis robusta TaxID=568900 RepID=A0A9N8HEH3_9STRA|nr:unknown protein [Seminavis robusta]|eukprot:Sro406_g136450.1 n/a (302) ;mRNA; f:48969-50029